MLCRPLSTPLATAAKAAKMTLAMSANRNRASRISTRVKPASGAALPPTLLDRPGRLPYPIRFQRVVAYLLPIDPAHRHFQVPHGHRLATAGGVQGALSHCR